MSNDAPAPAHRRSREEIIEEMRQQLRALNTLADQFREGEPWAAKLMATVIYTICHDGRRPIVSLITQLGLREELQCITTATKPVQGNLVTMPLMLGLRVGAGAGFRPRFLMHDVTKFDWIPFEQWWNEPVYSQGETNIITRSQLVHAVRSKDGGSHFDAELASEHYVNLRAGAGWKLVSDDGDETEPEMAHLQTIWAIGWELTVSLNGRERLQQMQHESGSPP